MKLYDYYTKLWEYEEVIRERIIDSKKKENNKENSGQQFILSLESIKELIGEYDKIENRTVYIYLISVFFVLGFKTNKIDLPNGDIGIILDIFDKKKDTLPNFYLERAMQLIDYIKKVDYSDSKRN